MGIFDSILDKLGFGDKEKEEVPAQEAEALVSDTSGESEAAPQAAEGNDVQAVAVVDVVSKLEEMAAANPENLNWKTSIVDLMKLLGLDSSYAHRKELAKELGCPESLMGDSAQMNIWLHKTVLQKIAENGGNIPADLL